MRSFEFYKNMILNNGNQIYIHNNYIVDPQGDDDSGSTIDLVTKDEDDSHIHIDGFFLLNVGNSGLFLFDGVGTCDIYIQEIHTHGDERLLVTGVDLDDFMV